MRKTKTLTQVQELFDRRQGAVSVVELVDHFSEVMNKVTVYRILARLEKEGVIHSVRDKDGLTWYAKCQHCLKNSHDDHHPHFQCNKCGRMTCIPMTVTIPKIENHKIEKESILLVGECEDCQTALENS